MNMVEDKREYAMLQTAYDFFNTKFFEDKLPKVFFTAENYIRIIQFIVFLLLIILFGVSIIYMLTAYAN